MKVQSLARDRWERFIWRAPVVCRITFFLWKVKSVIQYWATGDCGNACEVVEPYGFIPEADCPVHDREGIDMEVLRNSPMNLWERVY